MSKTWKKTTVSIESKVDAQTTRKRSYNNIVEGASEENILAFAKIIAQLTGQATVDVTATTVDTLADDAAAE